MPNVSAEALVLREAKMGASFDDLRYMVYWDPDAHYQSLLGNIEGGNGYVPIHYRNLEAAELAVRSVLHYLPIEKREVLLDSWEAKRGHLLQIKSAAYRHSLYEQRQIG